MIVQPVVEPMDRFTALIRFVNTVPAALAQTPRQVVSLGTGAVRTVGRVPATALSATGTALRAGATVLTRTPTAFTSFADSAVTSGKHCSNSIVTFV